MPPEPGTVSASGVAGRVSGNLVFKEASDSRQGWVTLYVRGQSRKTFSRSVKTYDTLCYSKYQDTSYFAALLPIPMPYISGTIF